ncbi:hypothetical protein NHP190003_15090 [Helicobacter sp. NHP19-003]|uniref:Uncharacterized protein n=1 Tax=Helicobacter gastrocanis TaxID=2849641 RepID=A0ABM7SKR1_9HELI|nr:hypothetical protein [Helicobacter sp. NHP19-003]BCZ18227.1 hypothetical protein NHP190003_15090 [Helicobacter sp. NHP19-003]
MLNIHDMSKSQVLLNAGFKDNLDHTMLTELSKKSSNFRQFLETLNLYHKTIEANMSDQTSFQAFDGVLSPENLEDYVKMEIFK